MKTLRLIFTLFCYGVIAHAQVQEGGPLYVPSVGGPVLGTTTVTMTNAACNVLSPGSTCTLTAPGAAAARPWYLNQSLAGTCGGSSTITYPLGQHYIFSNECGAAVTMGGATGATVSIPSGATNFEVNSPDGMNYYIVGSGGSTGASVTFAATGGASAGSSFNGSSALTVDYHTVGAQGAGNYLTTDGSITGALVNPQVFQQGVWATLGGVSTANPLPATVGYNYSATPTYMDGNYWTGTASAQDVWSFGPVLGTGTNPTSTLTFTHVGSPGAANIAMPALSVAGSPVCTTATGCGNTMTYPGANTLGVANTGNTAWRTPLYSDITALFGSGSCSGLLKSDGTCPLASTLNVNSALDVQCSLSDGCQNDNVWNSPWTATGGPTLAVGYPLGASDTTMTIVTLAGMPLAGHVVTTQGEEIGFTYVSSSGGNSTYTITRGHHGTPASAVSVGQGNMAEIISEVSACTTCGVYQQWGGNGSSIGVYNPGLTASFYASSISIGNGSPITSSGPGGVLGTAINHAATDFEPALGNPGTNGYVLSSTTGGTRSWIAPTSGGGTVTTSGSPVSPNIAAFSSSTAITAATSANIQTAIGAGVYDASGAAAARQANLSLLPGTYTDGDMCTYASSGTLLNCNTAIPSVGSWGALNYPSWTSGTPFVKMTAAGTFALDTNTYLTSLSGALLATGATTGATSQAQTFTDGVTANATSSFGLAAPSSDGQVWLEGTGSPYYGGAQYLTYDNGAAQSAFRLRAAYLSNSFFLEGSTTTQAYLLDPSALTYATLMTVNKDTHAVTFSGATAAGPGSTDLNGSGVPEAHCLADGSGGGVCGAGLAHSDYAHVEGTLFATNTMLGPVFAEPLQVHFKTIIVRLSGTISCTGAPVVSMMDLGTSPSTAFGSAIGSVAAVTTGTSDGVYQYSASVNMTPGDYYGFAFTGGTCVTAPTFDITAQVQ